MEECFHGEALVFTPSFLEKVFKKVPDAEGRVLDPFECGGMNIMESLRLY